jgi:hypothetical protein
LSSLTIRMFFVSHTPLYRPREEKLFELGWKDDCYFYGDPETYMTLPCTLKAGRQLHNVMATARGTMPTARNSTFVPPFVDPNEITTREELDRFVHHSTQISDEDCFLPCHIRSPIHSLPSILRGDEAHRMCSDDRNIHTDHNLSFKMTELSRTAERLAAYILPPLSDRANWSYGRFGPIDQLGGYILPADCRTMLELLPTLRRIGALERATENASLLVPDDTSRSRNLRSTRRQAKARRHHYFDKISPSLRRDEYDINSSEVGSLLADMLLTSL